MIFYALVLPAAPRYLFCWPALKAPSHLWLGSQVTLATVQHLSLKLEI
jgi:hypothetical protein